MNSFSYKYVIGVVLTVLVLLSAFLGIGGVWGWIKGDSAWQVFLTFLIVGGTVAVVTYVAHAFFGVG
jgi:hypothetical protein